MKRLILHPFLFAIYPAFFLYAQNINRFSENVITTPLFISLGFAIFVYAICQLIIRKWEISAILSSFLILIFFSYSRLKEPIKNIQLELGKIEIGPDEILILASLLALALLIFFIGKYKHRLRGINKLLSILSAILIGITIFNTSFQEIKLNRSFFALQIGKSFLSNFTDEYSKTQSLPLGKQTPDIYYFILDRYAGEKTLKSYGFDNNPFLEFLRTKGFYITSESTSNYPKTFLSLGSTLNMDYLDDLTQKTNGGGTSDESIVTPLVKNNKVIKFLKNKGYTYIHVGSGWDPTRSNSNANQNFVFRNGRYPFADEFTTSFLQTTAASHVLKKLYPDTSAVSRIPKNNEERSRTLYEFEVFSQIPQIPGPKFVFAHILIPHDPYVLGKDCEPLPEKVTSKRSTEENYLNQMQCANKKMQTVIAQILTNSTQTPIIIIQADEGPLPMKNPISTNLDWKNASDNSLREKFPIINAYLLPGIKNNPLYPSITPVNSFRIIFNTYFNSSLPLLPDKNYIFENDKSYYKFIDVTDRLKENLEDNNQ